MIVEAYTQQLSAILLLSLRIAPLLAFAPPFTYLRIPASTRVFLGFALSAWLVFASPQQTTTPVAIADAMLVAAASELFLGITLTLCLHLAFGAMLTAGRAIDFQVGFGLALLADPTLRTQMPLVGTLFAYAAAMIFFSTTGATDLLAIWGNSLERIPVGGVLVDADISALLSYISTVFVLALGRAGLVLLTLLLIDITIAFLSRTLPQMNVLLLGFQVKTLALLATLPFVFAWSGALFLRILRLAIDTTLTLA